MGLLAMPADDGGAMLDWLHSTSWPNLLFHEFSAPGSNERCVEYDQWSVRQRAAQGLDGLDQLVITHRLVQVPVEARLARLVLIGAGPVAGKGDGGGMAQVNMGAQGLD